MPMGWLVQLVQFASLFFPQGSPGSDLMQCFDKSSAGTRLLLPVRAVLIDETSFAVLQIETYCYNLGVRSHVKNVLLE